MRWMPTPLWLVWFVFGAWPDFASADSPIIFPPDTPTTATILHTFEPNSGSWQLEAPHEFNKADIIYTSPTSKTLSLAPLVYLVRFNNGGRIARDSLPPMTLSSGKLYVLQVGRRASKSYSQRSDYYFQGYASASSSGYAGAYATVSVTALNYSLNLGGASAGSSSAGFPDSSGMSFSGTMMPGIAQRALATVTVYTNFTRGGYASGSSGVSFHGPEGSLGGVAVSASFYGAGQFVDNIYGQPLDDMDTIPAGDVWMLN